MGDLAATWALDRAVTTTVAAARHRHRLEGELAKICEERSLSGGSGNAGRGKAAVGASPAPSTVGKAAHRTTQQEARRLLWEQQASTSPSAAGGMTTAWTTMIVRRDMAAMHTRWSS